MIGFTSQETKLRQIDIDDVYDREIDLHNLLSLSSGRNADYKV